MSKHITSAVLCCETEAFEIEGSGHDYGCPGPPAVVQQYDDDATEARRRDQRDRKRRARQIAYAQRILVEGRLVAPGSDVRHGLSETYQSKGCRCWPCTIARAEARKDRQ